MKKLKLIHDANFEIDLVEKWVKHDFPKESILAEIGVLKSYMEDLRNAEIDTKIKML